MSKSYRNSCFFIKILPKFNFFFRHSKLKIFVLGKCDEAFVCFEKCLAADPQNEHAENNKCLTVNYMESLTPVEVERHHMEYGETVCKLMPPPFRSWLVDKTASKRPLRIGYVSPDLMVHSVSYFIHSVLNCHDPSRFEVYVYAQVLREDWKTEMFKQLVPQSRWRSIIHNGVPLGDQQVANMIRNDQIDILIDLTGHCSNNRLKTMALKPAPIIVGMIGYPNITG